jgi:hypothetical protein
MGQHRSVAVFGLDIVWDGGGEVLVKDGQRVIERHPTEPMAPLKAGRLINRLEQEMISAARGMEVRA